MVWPVMQGYNYKIYRKYLVIQLIILDFIQEKLSKYGSLPEGWFLFAQFLREDTGRLRGNRPFTLAYFSLILCLRENIRAVDAQEC